MHTMETRTPGHGWAGGRLLAAVVAAGVVLSTGPVHSLQTWTSDGWRQATAGYDLVWPRDHASHPEYRIEWWYYTGNLEAADGRRFGYQVTFFRVGVDPAPENPSRWAVRDLHMAHLALTDVSGQRHLVAERLNRAGVGWAGASSARLDVWNEDWRVTLEDTTHVLSALGGTEPLGVELRLDGSMTPVTHGVDGLSQKGSQIGNASHYYSLTRMPTSGALTLDGEVIAVNGFSWMDHEFGTSFLEPEQRGWDWFSLQLDDGTDLMVYVLRRRDGSIDRHSSGTLVRPGGETVRLAVDDYRLTPGRTWTSPTSEATYPVEWRIDIPKAQLELTVRAAVDAQELHTGESTGVTYWEGVVDATGTRAGHAVTGRGYLEMTGYAGAPLSEVLR